MQKSFKWLCLLSFILICPEVFAALFDVDPNDKSKEYLGTIFGGSVGLVYLGGGANPLLSKMFEQFNFIIVTIGSIVISYIGVLSVINTAREGEALGRKFSAWVVMRAFTGMLLMVPTPGTGYSLVQTFVIWVVLNGIGAANLVWNVVLDQIGSGIQAVGTSDALTGATLNLRDTSIKDLAKKVLASSVCMQSINSQSGGSPDTNLYGTIRVIRKDEIPDPPTKPGVRTNPDPNAPPPPNSATGRTTLYVGVEKSPGVYIPICGTYTITTSYTTGTRWTASAADTLSRLNIMSNAVIAMFDSVSPAATLISQNVQPSQGYIASAISAYKGQITQLSTRALKDTNSNKDISDAKKIGWIHAGNYYFSLSQSGSIDQDSDMTTPPLIVDADKLTGNSGWTYASNNAGPPEWPANLLKQMQSKEANITRLNTALIQANTYATNASETLDIISIPNLVSNNAGTGSAIIDALISILIDPITKLFVGVMQDQMNNAGDPIAGLARFGWGLMTTAEISGIAMMIASFALSLISSPMMCVSPAAPPVNLVLLELWLVLAGLCIMLWTAGATLNIYLPMVPYLVFTSTAFGWMMAVVEAIVGAPIIALGLVQPSGDEVGKVAAGLSILANVFLRPLLMIFGFILAAGLVRAGVQFVNFGFLTAVTGKPPISTLFSFLAVLLMYMMFMIGIFNKAFSLIYELPNKVLRYMGVQEERHEPTELVNQGKSGFDKGSDASSKALGKGLEKTSKKIDDDRKEHAKKAEK